MTDGQKSRTAHLNVSQIKINNTIDASVSSHVRARQDRVYVDQYDYPQL